MTSWCRWYKVPAAPAIHRCRSTGGGRFAPAWGSRDAKHAVLFWTHPSRQGQPDAPTIWYTPVVSLSPAPVLRWVVTPPADLLSVRTLAETLRVPPALAALLIQRGHDSVDAARRYLKPALADISDPHALAGMDQAVQAVSNAVRAGH